VESLTKMATMNTNASNSYHIEVEGNPLLKDVNVFPVGPARNKHFVHCSASTAISRTLLDADPFRSWKLMAYASA
jgi:hypothetical protein